MFFPVRHQSFVVFDIRLLIPAKSAIEERIYLEAIRRTPPIFGKGSAWGDERSEACLWIPAAQYDATLQDIRLDLRHDAHFVRQSIGRMNQTVDDFRSALQSGSSMSPVPLLESCVNAVAWFVSNWIHPRQEVRLALARFQPVQDPALLMAKLLRRRAQPLYLRAHSELLKVAGGHLSREEYLEKWGPVYGRGDEPGPLRNLEDLDRMLDSLPRAPIRPAPPKSDVESELLRSELIVFTRKHCGADKADLLDAQISCLENALDSKEEKHFVQQHFYHRFRQWLAVASPSQKADLGLQVRWLAPALLPPCSRQLQWPEYQSQT